MGIIYGDSFLWVMPILYHQPYSFLQVFGFVCQLRNASPCNLNTDSHGLGFRAMDPWFVWFDLGSTSWSLRGFGFRVKPR